MVGSRRRSGEAANARALALALAHGDAAGYVVEEAASLAGVVVAALYVEEDGRLICAARSGTVGPDGALDRLAREAHAAEAVRRDGSAFALPVALPGRPPAGALVLVVRCSAGETPPTLEGAALAELAAALLDNERRLRVSAAEARQDPLTGLRNRRAFAERLARLLSGERDAEVGVVFCDLDDFKAVNDHHGYAAGDEVLRESARVLSAQLRPGEELFRIGGDEFAVLVLGDRAASERVAARLRDALTRRRRGPKLPTVSTGVAVAPADGLTVEELVGSAARGLVAGRHAARARIRLAPAPQRLRLLAVDDDESLRLLLRTAFGFADISVEEAATGAAARAAIDAGRPDVVVLDVSLPDVDGLELTQALKRDPATAAVPIVLLTGGDTDTLAAGAAGADALVRKPFSPLELLNTVERVAAGAAGARPVAAGAPGADQLLLYANDLGRLLELERLQRRALEGAYRETVAALARALEMRDTGTGAHSVRVHRYATELAATVDPALLEDASVEYGFLLHDIGKLGIPDRILQKPGPLTPDERRVMQSHAPVGAQMLTGIGQLSGEGVAIVRHHHERWDGHGYPDRLAGGAIPLGARIFAVADALDAITSDRPYRRAASWDTAVAEIRGQAGAQFDPRIVEAFVDRERSLRRVHAEIAAG